MGYLQRPLSHGVQMFDTQEENWPVTQPIPKVESLVQCTGEAQFISDIDNDGILHAAFALTTVANADLGRIDVTAAEVTGGKC